MASARSVRAAGSSQATKPVSRLVLLALGAAVLILDQFTKWLVVASMPVGDSRAVVDGVLWISHVRNTGAAFGILRGVPGLLALAATAGIVVAVMIVAREPGRLSGTGAALVAAGAAGNLTDRLARDFPFGGSVVDFVDFRFWPAFNVADTAVSVGVGLLLLASFREGRPQPGTSGEHPAEPPGP